MAIIYLSRRLPDGIDLPTLDRFAEANRTSSPQRSYTWHFSMQGLPPAGVTTDSRELLPHVFTISRLRRASPPTSDSPAEGWLLFSVALSVPRLREDPAVHRCIALCCPDFP